MESREFTASLAPRAGDLLSLPFDQYGRMRIVQTVLNALYTAIGNAAEVAPTQERGAALAAPELEAAITEVPPTAPTPDPATVLGSGQPHQPVWKPVWKARVLDVGGYPGILPHFLSPDYYDVSVLDVVPDDGSILNYTQGTGLNLPFPDASFHIVTALDTLEHIPNPDREGFLNELMRVAQYAVVLVNPVQSVEADVAEETLDEYIRWILDAQQEQLREHRDFGLPDAHTTEAAFAGSSWVTTIFPTANIYNWLLMMVAKHYLISMRDERASAFEKTLDRFYNLTFSDGDHGAPAYRGVTVAVKPGLESALSAITASYPPVQPSAADNALRLGLSQLLMTMLDLKSANHEDRKLREQIERRDKHIAAMEQKVAVADLQLDRANHELLQLSELQSSLADKDRHIENLTGRLEHELRSKDEHILYLENLLQNIEKGRVLRMTRRVSRLLGR